MSFDHSRIYTIGGGSREGHTPHPDPCSSIYSAYWINSVSNQPIQAILIVRGSMEV